MVGRLPAGSVVEVGLTPEAALYTEQNLATTEASAGEEAVLEEQASALHQGLLEERVLASNLGAAPESELVLMRELVVTPVCGCCSWHTCMSTKQRRFCIRW